MSKSAMTQGYWIACTGSAPHYQGQVYSEDTGHTIAVTYSDNTGADARAIAAVPDMVEALQIALPVLNMAHDEHGTAHERNPQNMALRACHEALEKAGVQS